MHIMFTTGTKNNLYNFNIKQVQNCADIFSLFCNILCTYYAYWLVVLEKAYKVIVQQRFVH